MIWIHINDQGDIDCQVNVGNKPRQGNELEIFAVSTMEDWQLDRIMFINTASGQTVDTQAEISEKTLQFKLGDASQVNSYFKGGTYYYGVYAKIPSAVSSTVQNGGTLTLVLYMDNNEYPSNLFVYIAPTFGKHDNAMSMGDYNYLFKRITALETALGDYIPWNGGTMDGPININANGNSANDIKIVANNTDLQPPYVEFSFDYIVGATSERSPYVKLFAGGFSTKFVSNGFQTTSTGSYAFTLPTDESLTGNSVLATRNWVDANKSPRLYRHRITFLGSTDFASYSSYSYFSFYLISTKSTAYNFADFSPEATLPKTMMDGEFTFTASNDPTSLATNTGRLLGFRCTYLARELFAMDYSGSFFKVTFTGIQSDEVTAIE